MLHVIGLVWQKTRKICLLLLIYCVTMDPLLMLCTQTLLFCMHVDAGSQVKNLPGNELASP